MKRLMLVSAVFGFLVGLTGICSAAENADEILGKVQKACDPNDKCKSIHTMVFTSKIKMFDGREGELEVSIKNPGKIRIEVNGPDFTMMRMCDGKKGWEFSNKDGIRDLTGKGLDILRFQAFSLLPDTNLKQIFPKATLEGDAEFAGSKCYKLKCEPAAEYNLKPCTVLVDKETFLVVKSEQEYMIGNELSEIVTVYEDYKDVDGVMVPMTMISTAGDKVRELKIDSVEWNRELPDSDFEAPMTLENQKQK